jgi:hypothetical protein
MKGGRGGTPIHLPRAPLGRPHSDFLGSGSPGGIFLAVPADGALERGSRPLGPPLDFFSVRRALRATDDSPGMDVALISPRWKE